MTGLFIGFWLRNAPLVKVIGNPISDGSLFLISPCLMRIIKRVQKSLKRFWWPSGAPWLVSLSYYCIWCVFFWFPKVEHSFCVGLAQNENCPSQITKDAFSTTERSNRPIGVRAGGARGAAAPPNFGNSDFLGSTRKFRQSQFLKTSPCFYYYFEEINIFYFNLKSA